MKKILFTEQEIKSIIFKYEEENLSLAKIGEDFSVSKNVIKNVLIREGILLRTKTTKYKQNNNIFDKIDSKEKAYWLGFIAADGCVYKNKENSGTLVISLHQKDLIHLQKFKAFIGTDRKIQLYINNSGFGNNTPMCKLAIYSTRLVDDIVDKGVPQRKSLILKKPLIEEKFWTSFILGYFDGDGSIFRTKTGYSFSILGTENILTWIKEVLSLKDTRIEESRGIKYIRCGGKEKPYQALNKIYDNNIYCLQRKKDLFKEMEKVVLDRNI